MATIMVEVSDDLKAGLERAAAASSRGEADLICEGIRPVLTRLAAPAIGILVSDDPLFAQHVDEETQGFGDR